MVFRWATILLLICNGIAAYATQASWPSLLVALERGYRPGLEELPQVATALADAPEEVLIAWDQQGRFLFHVVGSNHDVRIGRSLVRQLQNSIVIHNHPRGYPPSPRDLDTVLRSGLRRLYVVARIDGVVSLIDVSRGDALRRWHQGGGFPDARPAWRPVAATAASNSTARPAAVAAEVAYSLLGMWL